MTGYDERYRCCDRHSKHNGDATRRKSDDTITDSQIQLMLVAKTDHVKTQGRDGTIP